MGEYVSTQTLVSSSFFLGKVTALGVLVLLCFFVCLTLLASFVLPSHLSLKHVHCTCVGLISAVGCTGLEPPVGTEAGRG